MLQPNGDGPANHTETPGKLTYVYVGPTRFVALQMPPLSYLHSPSYSYPKSSTPPSHSIESPGWNPKHARQPAMALGVSVTSMAFLLLFSLVALCHCSVVVQLQAESATNTSASYSVVVPAKVHAVQDDAEELLRLPSSVAEPDPDRSLVEPVAEPDPDRSPVEHVAEPDPDRSHPDSDELQETKKPCSEGQQGSGKAKELIDDDEDRDNKEEEEKEKAHKKKEGKKKTKRHHDGDDKGKKEKTKQHRQSDDEDKQEEENTKKQIHRQHHAKDESMMKKNKLSHHIKNYDSDDDSDDEEEEKKAKRWRNMKAIKRRFGPGRRSQREEAAKDKVNN